MNRLDELYKITLELENVLDQDITSKNREEIINRINDIVEQRGILMKEITPPYTEKEKQIGQKVVHLNKQIEQKMNTLFDALKHDMRQIRKQKESNRSYINPYGKIKSTDGMFLDSKQ